MCPSTVRTDSVSRSAIAPLDRPRPISVAISRSRLLSGSRLDALRRAGLLAPPHLPQEQSQRPGHVPTAINVPWSKAANDDGTFRSDDELRALYSGAGVDFGRNTIAYCRIGERSSHTWFVLHELLGQANVRNYDGSWTEYGSLVGVPIALGDQPGEPAR